MRQVNESGCDKRMSAEFNDIDLQYLIVEGENGESKRVSGVDANTAAWMEKFYNICRLVSRTTYSLLSLKKTVKGELYVEWSELGVRLRSVLGESFAENIRNRFPSHVFNPFISTFLNKLEKQDVGYMLGLVKLHVNHDVVHGLIEEINDFIDEYRAETCSTAFKTMIKNHKRRYVKNKIELCKLVDILFYSYSRVMVVRIDLGYKMRFTHNSDSEVKIELSDVKCHRDKLLKELRKKFKGAFITYAWKLEYGLQKGYHYHCLLFFDGAKLRQDVTVGKIVGETWYSVVGENALYYNCNGAKEKYVNVCVGIVSHDQYDVIGTLKKNVASYLTKPDCFMHFEADDRSRTFGKGGVPKHKINGLGRPRSKGKKASN